MDDLKTQDYPAHGSIRVSLLARRRAFGNAQRVALGSMPRLATVAQCALTPFIKYECGSVTGGAPSRRETRNAGRASAS